jgi:hypothetical protein
MVRIELWSVGFSAAQTPFIPSDDLIQLSQGGCWREMCLINNLYYYNSEHLLFLSSARLVYQIITRQANPPSRSSDHQCASLKTMA